MAQAQQKTFRESLVGGAAGAAVLTLVHQGAKVLLDDAPEIDTIGRRVLANGMKRAGINPPVRDKLQVAALLGDLVSNTAYYALVGVGDPKKAIRRGALLGALAGTGVLALPPLMNLGTEPQARTTKRAAMSFGWYLLGGLAAAAVFKRLARSSAAR